MRGLPVQSVFHDSDGRLVRARRSFRGRAADPGAGLFPLPESVRRVRASLFGRSQLSRLAGGARLRAGRAQHRSDRNQRRCARGQDSRSLGLRIRRRGARLALSDGSRRDISAVADAVGFRDRLDPESRQFVHPAGLVFVTPRRHRIELSAGRRLHPGGSALGRRAARRGPYRRRRIAPPAPVLSF